MHICGIVSEYDPFHNGHQHQIEQVKRTLGQDCAIVCCMSGNFLQRGSAAMMPKHERATAAVTGGADLVLELPAVYSLLSAEGFAAAAVHILASLSQLTHLSFGAETADAQKLTEIAKILLEHETVQSTLAHLQSGISYAAARERALYARISENASIIKSPNNILAVEYCKALLNGGHAITPLPIERKGAAHDSTEAVSGFASASLIRTQLRSGALVDEMIPHTTAQILEKAKKEKKLMLDLERLNLMMLSRLLPMSPEQLERLPGASEGVEHRIWRSLRLHRDPELAAQHAKTRRYPHSRLRRMLMCGFLGIERSHSESPPPYARVLAFSDAGRQVLHRARKTASLPIITKPAHIEKLEQRARDIFERECTASLLYHTALGNQNFVGEHVQNPIFVK